MRIVIDLQGAQTTGSRNRGIGRYSTALAQAIIRNRNGHDVHLLLNGRFPAEVEELRKGFEPLIGASRIHVFEPLAHIASNVTGSAARRKASQEFRELFIRRLRPDVVHVSSLFEGLIDDAVCSIGDLYTDVPTSVTVYDLIPLIHRDRYLNDPSVRSWYFDRIDNVRRADACFAISESARREAIEHLGFDEQSAVNVSTAADPKFRKVRVPARAEAAVRTAHAIDRPFVMYTGGIDLRKNIERLIEAYALLPKGLRAKHQLAVVCSASDADKQRLLDLARKAGLESGELVMTGFVTDDELILLYNLAKLFVFPSWHEGFGLPALEAMHCGAPVIASNRSSIPEVVGPADALFDPFDERDMAAHIRRGLEDEAFRRLLVETGAKRAAKFSWDESGRRAVGALERLHRHSAPAPVVARGHRPSLAIVTPMPPARTGIADYVAELLPSLSRHFKIDVIVKDSDVAAVDYPLCPDAIRVVAASTFQESWGSYDRILYQFGNSEFHDYMVPLLELTSGVVVLHDLFLSGLVSYRQWHNQEPGGWFKELYRAHGYSAARAAAEAEDPYDAVWKYPCSYSVLEHAQRVIVHSSYTKREAGRWYGDAIAEKIGIIPHLREPWRGATDRRAARDRLGIGEDAILVCSFGLLGMSKCNLELLDAWSRSRLARDSKCRLVFVGENDSGEYGQHVSRKITAMPAKSSVALTGWADRSTFEDYLAAADFAVQLRARSRGESSGTVLDCMSRGVPLIVNANGPMAELPPDAAIILPDRFETAALASAIERLREDRQLRERIGRAGRRHIEEERDPETCAEAYGTAIDAAARDDSMIGRLAADCARVGISEAEAGSVSRELARTLSEAPPRLLIDITALVQTEAQTGIQRVVRNLLSRIIDSGAGAYRVEPVYVDPEAGGFRFARNFTARFANLDLGSISDDIVDITPKDILLLLDLNPVVLGFATEELARLRRQGTRSVFVVYDLLPIHFPKMFPKEAEELHRRWVAWVSEASAALCISEAVADELRDYLAENAPESEVAITSFPLGNDVAGSQGEELQATISSSNIGLDADKPTFIAVGTIEPRKGYGEILDAFEKIWASGEDANLCIVGRPGWEVDALVKRLEEIVDDGKPLVWLRDADDDLLELAYRSASCLIAASYGEGFGLPIVEAAARGLPLIARDIPVFREVAGKGATYFSSDLARTLRRWLDNYRSGKIRGSEKVALTTWEQSAEALLRKVLGNDREEAKAEHDKRNRNRRDGAGRRISGATSALERV